MVLKIGVVGAGIMGLSTAVNIQRQIPNVKVTIIADKFITDTTSAGAGGIFRPTSKHIRGVDPETIQLWIRESYSYYKKIATSPEAGKYGIFKISGYHLSNEPQAPDYKDLVYSFREMTQTELDKIGTKYSHGYAITTLIIEPGLYMPQLMREFKNAGGTTEQRTLQSLEQLVGQYDIVVNCSGLASKWLVNDPMSYPIRGQLVKIKAPWIKNFLYTDDDCYIIPRSTDVVLGGCRIKDDYGTDIREDMKQQIIRQCAQFEPSIKEAEFVSDWAGLRPHRDPVRLETEIMRFTAANLPVVHNYGHGSNGIALSWGTSVYATRLVRDLVQKLTLKSHL